MTFSKQTHFPKIRSFYFLLLLLGIFCQLFSFSCTKTISLISPNTDTVLIVQGQLSNDTAGNPAIVYLTLNHPLQKDIQNLYYQQPNGLANPASGAKVTIQENNGAIYPLTEQFGEIYDTSNHSNRTTIGLIKGVYINKSLKGVPGYTYHLVIHYQGHTYESTSTMPLLVQLNSISIDTIPKTSLIINPGAPNTITKPSPYNYYYNISHNYQVKSNVLDPPTFGNSYQYVLYTFQKNLIQTPIQVPIANQGASSTKDTIVEVFSYLGTFSQNDNLFNGTIAPCTFNNATYVIPINYSYSPIGYSNNNNSDNPTISSMGNDSLLIDARGIDPNVSEFFFSLNQSSSIDTRSATTNPGNPVGNITGGAIGFFGAISSNKFKILIPNK
jgi:hypothetical protein